MSRADCHGPSPAQLSALNWWLVSFLAVNAILSVGAWQGLDHGGDWGVFARASTAVGTPRAVHAAPR